VARSRAGGGNESGYAELLPFCGYNRPAEVNTYKYGMGKTKLVCGGISTTYDFHRHNKAGMLLKTNEG
jgi:hypothetical protein